MYARRLRLYEPIVNSLLDRITNEAFSPSGLHKLVPVKNSLQNFGVSKYGSVAETVSRGTRLTVDFFSRDECERGLELRQ